MKQQTNNFRSKRQRFCETADLIEATKLEDFGDWLPQTGKYINMLHPTERSPSGRVLAEMLRINQLYLFFDELERIQGGKHIVESEMIGDDDEIFRVDDMYYHHAQRVTFFLEKDGLDTYLAYAFGGISAKKMEDLKILYLIDPDNDEDVNFDYDKLIEANPLEDILDALWEDYVPELHSPCGFEGKRFLYTEKFSREQIRRKDNDSRLYYPISFILVGEKDGKKETIIPIDEKGRVKYREVAEFIQNGFRTMNLDIGMMVLNISPEERDEIRRQYFIPLTGPLNF